MSSYVVTDAELTAVADGFRFSRESDKKLTLEQMAEMAHEIPIKLPSATSIGDNFFQNCTTLTSIDVPSLETIGSYAFSGCTALKKIIGEYVSASVGEYAFSGCTALTDVDFDIMGLGDSAFRDCISLENIILGEVETIGNYVFNNCTALKTFGNSVGSIVSAGDYAFYGCRSLLDEEEFFSLETIGNYAFAGCSALERLELRYLRSIGNNAFANCMALKFVNIESLDSISNYCFNNCGSLNNIISNESNIGNYSFNKCVSLEDFYCQALSIGKNSFSGCAAMKNFNAERLLSIGDSAFDGCSVLADLSLGADSVCSISNVNVFNGTPFALGGTGGTVHVPEELIESYKTATNWSTLYAAGTCNFVAI